MNHAIQNNEQKRIYFREHLEVFKKGGYIVTPLLAALLVFDSHGGLQLTTWKLAVSGIGIVGSLIALIRIKLNSDSFRAIFFMVDVIGFSLLTLLSAEAFSWLQEKISISLLSNQYLLIAVMVAVGVFATMFRRAKCRAQCKREILRDAAKRGTLNQAAAYELLFSFDGAEKWTSTRRARWLIIVVVVYVVASTILDTWFSSYTVVAGYTLCAALLIGLYPMAIATLIARRLVWSDLLRDHSILIEKN